MIKYASINLLSFCPLYYLLLIILMNCKRTGGCPFDVLMSFWMRLTGLTGQVKDRPVSLANYLLALSKTHQRNKRTPTWMNLNRETESVSIRVRILPGDLCAPGDPPGLGSMKCSNSSKLNAASQNVNSFYVLYIIMESRILPTLKKFAFLKLVGRTCVCGVRKTDIATLPLRSVFSEA
jgi:hypothetical protein